MKPFAVDQLEGRRLMSINLVADFNGFYPTDSVEVDGIAYFTANDGVHGQELWKSDGTPGGTQLVSDVTPGSLSSPIYNMRAVEGGVVFFVLPNEGKRQLWFSDGTAEGTVRLAQFNPDVYINYVSPRAINNRVVFTVTDSNDGMYLWSTDGSSKRTRQIATLTTPAEGYGFSPSVIVGQRVLFTHELGGMWSTDGTAAGTFKIPQMQSDLPSDMVGLGWDIVRTVELNGELIFTGNFSMQIWRTDGTVEGTKMVAAPGYRLHVSLEDNGKIHLFGHGQDQDTHWWVTDGTSAGTHELTSFGERYIVTEAFAYGDKVYAAGRLDDAIRIWSSDGTPAGTHVLATIPGTMAGTKVGANGHLMVLVYGAAHNVELWSIDPDSGQTAMLKSFGQIGLPEGMVHGDALYFQASGTIWRSDGTPGGTIAIANATQLAQYGLAIIDGRLVVAWTGDGESQAALISDSNTTIAPAQSVARLKDGVLRIYGTPLNDAIRVYQSAGDRLGVSINGVKRSFDEAAVKKIIIYGYSGDDRIELYERYGAISARSRIWGGSGADTVNGGSGADSIFGDGGNDRITSGASADVVMAGKGNDSVNGGAGNDTASGNAGLDSLIGGSGQDLLSGGQDQDDDWIDGGNGVDVLFGQAVYDVFFKPQNGESIADQVLQN